ncbi:hypothetical protein Sjap_014666 [Stephania japonica]|uniref:ALA-interacting subunit n=1 Tax=Stephania japonica TaxID=461633 RepID=A0AAP0NRP7_9MAGN
MSSNGKDAAASDSSAPPRRNSKKPKFSLMDSMKELCRLRSKIAKMSLKFWRALEIAFTLFASKFICHVPEKILVRLLRGGLKSIIILKSQLCVITVVFEGFNFRFVCCLGALTSDVNFAFSGLLGIHSRFTQQELPACKPILTPGWVISTFVLVGIVFIPIGLASLFASQRVVEIVDRYDSTCIPQNYVENALGFIQSGETNKTCTRNLIVPKHMKRPVYIYYELDNFYQNHRRYVKSREDKQLRSKKYENVIKNCDPEATTSNGSVIVPCGLIAWSLFNDTYGFSVNNKAVEVNKKNIAWKSDRDRKFGSDVYPKNFQSKGLIGGAKLDPNKPLSEQEDLIVWMRTAALPTFRKLYGKIEVDLEANQKVKVVIQNNYNTYSFGGKKKLVLSTTSWIGGKNDFLGIAYLTVGGLCLFLAISFIIIYLVKPRPLGDPSFLSWNRNPAGHLN